MKITINLYKALLICAAALLLWWVMSRPWKNDSDEQLEEFLKQKGKEMAQVKLKARADSLAGEKRIDSAARVYLVLEARRKADNNYYQTKINDLKKVNTYTARQRYSDSLARTVR